MSADDPALEAAVDQAQEGDEAAFATLYRIVQPGLVGYLYGIVGDVAEDIAAAAWREIARELPRFRGDGPGFRGWTASIARRHVLGHLRRRGASSRSTGISVTPPAARPLSAATLTAETAKALLAQLPHAQAEAVLLRHVVRLDEPVVARVMRRPRPVVRVLVHRGLRSLARQLGPDEVTHAVARTLGEPR